MSGSLAGEGAASVEGGRGAMPAPMPSRVGTARHTTGQKRADEELRVANERLEEAQRVAHLGSWELDPHMDKITASAEFFRLFDAAPAEIARYAQFVERLHPDDRERVNRDVAAALEEDRPYDTEYRVKLRDGGWRDINARGHVVTDADGKPAWFVGTCLDITERKRAAEELRLSQAMYKTIVDNIPQKVFVKGPDLRWASVNGPLARDFGLRPEDVVGKTNRELFPQDLADKYSADDQRIVETGATEEFDEEYLDKGERRFVHTIKTPVRDEAGTIQGVFGMFRDVTEEKRAEQRLRVANERLEEAQRVAHLGSWEWDPAGDQITGSAEFFRLFDAAPEEIVRYQQFVERLHPDDREHVDRDVAAALEGNRSYDTEYRVRLRDGGWRDINARGRLVTDPDGKPVRFVGTCLDITERKRAEGALRESERWYRTLAISLPHLVWTCRADGPCDYLSPRWVEYTGIPESEQLGYRWLEQLHPDDRDRVIAEWTEVAAHGESFDIEFRIRRADGVHRWFKTRAIPLRDNNGQLVEWFGSNTDIDDVKRASEELAAVNAELEDRVKARTAALEAANRELEAFSYSVSHDLRAPLRSVDGFSKILLQDHGEQLDAEARRVLGVVIRNVQQMGRLIDDLLAFSRVSRKELERQPVDMGKLARAVAEVLRAAEPERAIEVDIGSLGGTLGDSGLLRQVWVNLLGNAFKFTRPADRPRIEIRCEQVDGECRYTVRDNGVGFDPAYADNLFKPFQRLHPTAEFEGTGIGLAIVARIVQRHGGRVSAEGRPGAGATFGFSLPTSKEDT
jgi:PAS domain S-box-containing protein